MVVCIPELPGAVVTWAREHGLGRVLHATTLTGGCSNRVRRLHFAHGATCVLKTPGATAARADPAYAAEADGLRLLITPQGPLLPTLQRCAAEFLLLSDLGGASPRPGFWRELGQGLARIHARQQPAFGMPLDEVSDAPLRARGWMYGLEADGWSFFTERQLLPLARLALGAQPQLHSAVERLALQVRQLIPAQPPVVLHGDLWHGNVHSGPYGEPAVLDPAAHGGWAEMDLAMTRLFGGFPAEFYQAYEALHPPLPGLSGRLALYQLPALLNHLRLFGDGYLPQVAAHLARYVPV